MKYKTHKGALATLPTAVLMLVLIGIISAVGVTIISTMQANYGAGTTAFLALGNATTGISNITSNMGLLGTIIIFGVIIAVLIMYFGGFMGGGRRGA